MNVNQFLVALEGFDLNTGNGIAGTNELELQGGISSLHLNYWILCKDKCDVLCKEYSIIQCQW